MLPPDRLPLDIEAERATLGACFVRDDGVEVVAGILGSEDWFRDAHKRIWCAIRTVHAAGRSIDFVTIRDSLKRTNELDDVGGPAYISSLTDGLPRSANVHHYAGIVKEHAVRRRILHASLEQAPLATLRAVAAELDALGTENAAAPSIWMPKPVSDITGNDAAEPPVIARGLSWEHRLVCIHSPPKAGKSTIVAAVVAAITSGKPWLDQPTVQRTVLWIAEEPEADFPARHGQFGGDPTRLLVTDGRAAVRYAPGAGPRERLLSMIAAVDPGVVVFDTITHLAHLLGSRSLSSTVDAQALADFLLVVARERSVIANHHENRQEGGGYSGRMRDSSALEAASTLTWRFDAWARRSCCNRAALGGRFPR